MTAAHACFLEAPRSLGWRALTLAELPPGWVRVRFLHGGLCGSDLSKFEGRRDLAYPVSLGHEFVAEVLDVGEGVGTVAAGDVVTSDLNHRCGRCDQCRGGRSHLCREAGAGWFTNRAFADLGDLHASYLIRIDAPARQHLALAEPLSCTLHALEWADIQPAERVLVIGAGGMGSCMAFALCGRSHATSFEITDAMPARLSLISDAVQPSGTVVARATGEYDVVFDLSGSESGLRSACAHVRPGGRLCSLSHLDGYSTAGFLLGALTRRDVTFKLSYLNGELRTLETAARLLAARWDASWDAIVEVVPLQHLQRAFEVRRDSPWCKTLVDLR